MPWLDLWSGSLAQWAPTLVQRQSQLTGANYDSATASLYFGGITVVAGVLGTVAGSYFSKVEAHELHVLLVSYVMQRAWMKHVFSAKIEIDHRLVSDPRRDRKS